MMRRHHPRLIGFRNSSSRSARFSTLLLAVSGSEVANRTSLGTLYPAMSARQCATMRCSDKSAPGSGTTTATTRSPHLSSGSPTTAHFDTPSSRNTACSTSVE